MTLSYLSSLPGPQFPCLKNEKIELEGPKVLCTLTPSPARARVRPKGGRGRDGVSAKGNFKMFFGMGERFADLRRSITVSFGAKRGWETQVPDAGVHNRKSGPGLQMQMS